MSSRPHWSLPWFVVLAAVVLLSQACGASALDRATTALGAAHVAQVGVVETVEAGLVADLDINCGEVAPTEREACARARGESFRDAERALGASAETIDTATLVILTWAERVAAGEADEDAPPLPVCESLSQLVALVDVWSEVAGHDLPVKPWSCGGES